jgi:predicted aspartyl protease
MADFRYRVEKKLILIPVYLYGKHGRVKSRFVLDTGASYNIIDHSIADALGYSARDGVGFSTVSSAVGKERGYRLVIEGLEALGRRLDHTEVACHDLMGQGVEGLIGMAFLETFGWCLHPDRQVISVAA